MRKTATGGPASRLSETGILLTDKFSFSRILSQDTSSYALVVTSVFSLDLFYSYRKTSRPPTIGTEVVNH